MCYEVILDLTTCLQRLVRPFKLLKQAKAGYNTLKVFLLPAERRALGGHEEQMKEVSASNEAILFATPSRATNLPISEPHGLNPGYCAVAKCNRLDLLRARL